MLDGERAILNEIEQEKKKQRTSRVDMLGGQNFMQMGSITSDKDDKKGGKHASSSFQTAGNVFTRLFTKKKHAGSTLDDGKAEDKKEEDGGAGFSFEGSALNKLMDGYERSSQASRSSAAKSKYAFEAINEEDEEKVRS